MAKSKRCLCDAHITGGGEQHFKEGKEMWYLQPNEIFRLDSDKDDVVARVQALFA